MSDHPITAWAEEWFKTHQRGQPSPREIWNAALATAPAWKDAPICDGKWLRAPGYGGAFDLMHIAGSYIPPEGSRWFGPIPEDKP